MYQLFLYNCYIIVNKNDFIRKVDIMIIIIIIIIYPLYQSGMFCLCCVHW